MVSNVTFGSYQPEWTDYLKTYSSIFGWNFRKVTLPFTFHPEFPKFSVKWKAPLLHWSAINQILKGLCSGWLVQFDYTTHVPICYRTWEYTDKIAASCQTVVRDTQRQFPPKYIKIIFLAIQSTLWYLGNAFLAALYNLYLFGHPRELEKLKGLQ